MQVGVRFFAQAKELAGIDCARIELPESANVADLRVELGERYPAMRPMLPALLVAVGTEYADDETRIDPSKEIACFPPVSGG